MCNVEGPPLKKRKPQPLPPAEPFPIYLDYNATTPLSTTAWEAMTKVHRVWGNPSSSHPYGLAAKYELEEARKRTQEALHASSPDTIIFTSGGTEANNLAIVGGTVALRRAHPERRYVLSTNLEHPAVEKVLTAMQGLSSPRKEAGPAPTVLEAVRVPVDSGTGQLTPQALRECLEALPDGPTAVAMVSIMFANNEIGAVNDIKALCAVTKEVCGEACLFHTDAAQSLGKVPVDAQETGVDLLSVCGHKFYGPKGVGALYIKEGVSVDCVLHGAGHERGIRPGTENVLLAAGMSAALSDACTNLESGAAAMRATRDELVRVLKHELKVHQMDLVVNGSLSCALPNTLNCAIFKSIPNKKIGADVTFISAQRLILSVGDLVCMSAGSACHSTAEEGVDLEVSAPLKAVQVDLHRAIGTLRLSTGRHTTLDEVRRAGKIIARHAAQQFAE